MIKMTYITLFFFISFIALPTVMTMIDKDIDVSVCYSLNEEEIQKEIKEIKVNFNLFDKMYHLELSVKTSTKILFENTSKHDAVFEEIFSPPPELV
jgi:hypothetical protein